MVRVARLEQKASACLERATHDRVLAAPGDHDDNHPGGPLPRDLDQVEARALRQAGIDENCVVRMRAQATRAVPAIALLVDEHPEWRIDFSTAMLDSVGHFGEGFGAAEGGGVPERVPREFSNVDSVKERLSEFTGIEAIPILTNDSSAGSEDAFPANIRHCVPYLLQPQDVIASRNVFLPGLHDPFVERHAPRLFRAKGGSVRRHTPLVPRNPGRWFRSTQRRP
jgi:hypothetical protein